VRAGRRREHPGGSAGEGRARVRVGPIELDPIVDAWGELGELAELYPDVPAEAWEPYRELYPELFTESRWRLPCACYLIRVDGITILVDTAVGPPGLWGWVAESEGGLVPSLAALGVEPGDVDVVFLTHVHIDHIGWNADADGTPMFPNARYLIQPDGLAWLLDVRSEAPYVQRCLRSIMKRRLVDDVAAGEEIAPGVVTVDYPGHLPGHLGLRLGDDAYALLIADAAVHPALLDEPGWEYVADHDSAASVTTRRSLIATVVDQDILVVCGHYPGGGIGRVVRKDGRNVWVGSGVEAA
jgi:glyoxylase-like metal-dependent hydrolase (beta-lactamase superfamily II)